MDDKSNNPPSKKPVIFNLTETADEALDTLTTNRSWLVEKLIMDEFYRVQEAKRRGKPVRTQPVKSL